MAHEPNLDDIPVPALLRAARRAYGSAVRRSLAEAGFEDLPPNGPFVLGGLLNNGENLRDLLRALGMNRERGREFLVSMVQLGYMQRTGEPRDDGHVPVEPTERGHAAAMAVQRAVQDIDTKLAQRCSPEEIRGLRRALIALHQIHDARGAAAL